jgi:hypothetical protein
MALIEDDATIGSNVDLLSGRRQHRFAGILKPVADRLLAAFGKEGVGYKFNNILAMLRHIGPRTPGYAAGNILNLLLHLKSHLRDYDFSGLTVWQAYLQGMHVPDVNFAEADLSGAVFTDTYGFIPAVAFSPDGEMLAAGTTTVESKSNPTKAAATAGAMSASRPRAKSSAAYPRRPNRRRNKRFHLQADSACCETIALPRRGTEGQ